ncbi:transcriptional regulator [Salmonella enterica subsp. enterica]|uniref:Transcriptional regulator n=1 Tax=Salmonella enterica I TaxID=59201 RepID=A0A379VYB9_SALET|nr:transcriptional regulator [Salmonella enterica subsp. enterica]
MTEAQRHQILLDMLAQLGFVTVENVIERLGISPATARRDINKLDESGKLKKSAQRRRGHYPTAAPLDADESAPGAKPR